MPLPKLLVFREMRRSNAVCYSLLGKLHSNLRPGSYILPTFRNVTHGVQRFLRTQGAVIPKRLNPTLFFIGRGTSVYIGRSLVNLLPDSLAGAFEDRESIMNEQNN
jgi:hypothetical protein